MKDCFGVDIGGTTVKIGHISAEGKIIKKWEIPTNIENGGENILPDVAKALKAYAKENGINLKEMAGIGMGLPASILPDGTLIVAVNIGWGRMKPAEILSELMDGMTVKLGNDANVAALGEQWQGAGKGHNNIVMVTLGTGVGGGIILDGKIVVGTHGAGAEIGHIPVADEEDQIGHCGCTRTACVENVSSATGIVKLANKLVADGKVPTKLADVANITAKDVLDLAKEGDEGAVIIIEKITKYLAKALSAICVVVDPEVIVIGGGVSKAGAIITDNVKKYFKEMAFPAVTETPIVLAELGNDAGIIGGARMVLQ